MVHGQSSWNNIWPNPRPNTNMRDWVWMMEVCFDLMVHGQSSWNNIRPEPRPNTNMCDLVWMMEVCFDLMVHDQSSWNNIRPEPRPNTSMRDWVWMMNTILHGQSSWPFSPSSGNWPIYRLKWSKDIIGRMVGYDANLWKHLF